jgi:outer membrane receptor for monomeric catechols
MKHPRHSRTRRARLGGLATVVAASSLQLTSQAQAPAPATVATNEPTKILVEGLPIEETVLPTVRPVQSVMGDDRSVLETPRSVSLVTKAQMEARAVTRATDFNQYSPGVYTPSRYGLANVPVIRGDLGEIYQNGQRTIYSRNSLLASFNGVEAMDIVKGPGSAVYGPQGQGPGGYVNFVTKTPYFDGFHGDVTTRLGTYVPGGQSYFNPEWVLDFGGPISDKLAYRVSYLGREAEGYYQNVKDNTQDIFAALTWTPTDQLTLDWNAQFYTSRFNEVIGINRVTQELIDDWIYIAGPVQPNNVFGAPITSGPFFALLDPAQARRVHVYPYQTINAPFDSAAGHKFSSQLMTTYTISETAKVINRSYGEMQESRKLSGYGYTEWVPENWMINNRTEFHKEFTPSLGEKEIPIKTISGVDLRYSSLLSYQDFSTEPFFLYDVTANPNTFILPGLAPGKSFGGGFNIPGAPGYGGNPFPGAGNQESTLLQTGFFTQWDIALHERFSLVVGGRGDYFDAEANSPIFVERPAGAFYDTSADVLNGSVFVSGIFKWQPTLSSYVTYNLVNAVQGSANFGGVDGTGGQAGLERSLKSESELIEIGSKASILDNKLFLGAALFQQTRQAPQLVGNPIGIETKGIELEAVYQPTRSFNASANFTFQDAKQDDFGYQQTYNYRDGFPVGFIVDGQSGTGFGSPNYNSANGRVRAAGKQRAASVPQVMFNAYMTYQFDNGFGASVGPQVTGEQWQNQEGTLRIPTQFVINAFLFYRQPKWEVQVNFFNITDERNWTSIDPGFAGNDVIYPEKPFSVGGQIKYKF